MICNRCEDIFVSRTKLSYEANCLEIEYAETETEASELQKYYVMNKRSYVANLRDFDAAQSKLFLRLLPYLLSNSVAKSSAYYTFLIQIIEISQIGFSPVISRGTVTALEGQIEQHLKLFKQLFPDKNITPKQHYGINILSHIISLGPPTRASRFSFESAHNYFKELAQKQKFKNLPVSLAKCHQKLECYNFINNQLTPDSHSLFTTEKKFGVIKLM